MTTQIRKERRRYPRARRLLCIRHRLHKRGGKIISDNWHWHVSNTENMSAGGILFISDVPYKRNDIVEVKVVMSGILEIFAGLAKVVRVEAQKPSGVYVTAIAFCDLTKK